MLSCSCECEKKSIRIQEMEEVWRSLWSLCVSSACLEQLKHPSAFFFATAVILGLLPLLVVMLPFFWTHNNINSRSRKRGSEAKQPLVSRESCVSGSPLVGQQRLTVRLSSYSPTHSDSPLTHSLTLCLPRTPRPSVHLHDTGSLATVVAFSLSLCVCQSLAHSSLE